MNYIARGYVSLSEEHHRSRSPRRALSLRVRVNLFFLLPFSSVPFLRPPVHLIPARLSMENHSCQWSPAHVTSRILYAGNLSVRSSSSICRVFFLFLHPSPLFICILFLALSSAISGKKLFSSIVVLRYCYLILSHAYYRGYCLCIHDLI